MTLMTTMRSRHALMVEPAKLAVVRSDYAFAAPQATDPRGPEPNRDGLSPPLSSDPGAHHRGRSARLAHARVAQRNPAPSSRRITIASIAPRYSSSVSCPTVCAHGEPGISSAAQRGHTARSRRSPRNAVFDSDTPPHRPAKLALLVSETCVRCDQRLTVAAVHGFETLRGC